jgi:hypothetical protein
MHCGNPSQPGRLQTSGKGGGAGRSGGGGAGAAHALKTSIPANISSRAASCVLLRTPRIITRPPLADIPRIPDRCETRIVPSGVLSNAKSRTACAAGGQNRQLTAPRGHSVGCYLNNAKVEHYSNFEGSESAIQASSSSRAFASFRSTVSKPSVNEA